jgi:hypothetical protein
MKYTHSKCSKGPAFGTINKQQLCNVVGSLLRAATLKNIGFSMSQDLFRGAQKPPHNKRRKKEAEEENEGTA